MPEYIESDQGPGRWQAAEAVVVAEAFGKQFFVSVKVILCTKVKKRCFQFLSLEVGAVLI